MPVDRAKRSTAGVRLGAAGLAITALAALAGCGSGEVAPFIAMPDQSRTPAAGPTPEETPRTSEGLTVTFFGDSYTAGFGATSPDSRWSSLVSRHFGWIEDNRALSGTGFLADTSRNPQLVCEEEVCANVRTRIDESAGTTTDVVVIAAGINDIVYAESDPEEFEQSVVASFDAICAALPMTRAVIVITPFGRSEAPGPVAAEEERVVADHASRQGFVTIAGAAEWLVGRPELLLPDGGHPNDAGYALIATRIIAELESGDALERALDEGVC